MLQRVKNSQASGFRHEEDEDADQRGAHLMHMPNLHWMPGHSNTNQAPRLDYDLTVPALGRWYLWARAQCGPWTGTPGRVDGCVLHWGTNGDQVGSTEASYFGPDGNTIVDQALCWPCQPGVPCECRPPREGGSRGNQWTWVKLGYIDASRPEVQINLWGGGMGFRLDKLVLTRVNEEPSRLPDRAPRFIQDNTDSWEDVRGDYYQSYLDERRYGGPRDTGGRNGMACQEDNPYYRPADGQTVFNDIFDDAQPVRSAKEAAKSFVQRMRARFDQVAFVEYSDRSTITSELSCVWQRGTPDPGLGLGVYPDEAWAWCYDNGEGSIVQAIDSMVPQGSTNIAEAIQDGIEVLEPIGGHYGRPYALRFIIVLTDGVPNRWPNYRGRDTADRHWNHVCNQDDLWPIEGVEEEPGTEEEARARDCAIYYANQAKDKGIAVFTIGLGVNVDDDLLTAMAEPTESNLPGKYYAVTNEEELRAAFEEIANTMVLRLVE
jgi:hypothetical protein